MNLENLYLKSPVYIQQILINIQGYKVANKRFNNKFKHYLAKYFSSDYTNINKKELSAFLQEANKTDFWKHRFYEFSVNPYNIDNPISEIKKLPILTKNEVRISVNSISLKFLSEETSLIKTSGTTGSGLVFPQTLEMENRQWAVWWRYRSWYGIKNSTWMGWFGGRSIANLSQKKPPFWRINYPMKQVMFSAHHLNEKTVPYYFNMIKKRKLSWLHGYPSQLSLLANLIKERELGVLPDLKIVTVGAENLLSAQKRIIEEVFQAPVKQHYGLAEGVANISEHPDGMLRADQDFAFTEFIPVDASNPSICRIIGTNYSNTAFPLIRYDTGDIAHINWNENGSPIILSIDGRQEDYISLPNGVKLGRLDHIFKDLTEVQEAQIYQPQIDTVILRIVKGARYDELNQEKSILSESVKRLGKDVKIKIEYLNSIPRTKSGKLKFVISDIK